MTKILIDRAVVEQALIYFPLADGKFAEIRSQLRAALAQPEQPEQPAQRTGNCKLCGYCAATGERVSFANTALQQYKASQPKPASVEEIMAHVDNYVDAQCTEDSLESCGNERVLIRAQDASAKYRSVVVQAITQQAEALAQAQLLTRVYRYNGELLREVVDGCKATVDEHVVTIKVLSEQLAALQYDGELPELPEAIAFHDGDGFAFAHIGPPEDYFNGDQMENYARQAIANALAKQIKDNAEIIGAKRPID